MSHGRTRTNTDISHEEHGPTRMGATEQHGQTRMGSRRGIILGFMPHTSLFRGRRAASIENNDLRLTVVEGGGHIAEVFHKAAGVSPLWIPPWPSIEPGDYVASSDDAYGASVESRLLSGIMGHNLCLDIFGGPSDEEYAAGLQPHGEASMATYALEADPTDLRVTAPLSESSLRVERRLELRGDSIRVRESVENLSATDRPVAWTQHVTLGPPFLENGTTTFGASATRSKVLETTFGSADYLTTGAIFDWPHAPRSDGGSEDLRTFTARQKSGAYTTHLMNPNEPDAYFVAFSPTYRLSFGYVWKQKDFPWMGIWEENRSRPHKPWNGRTVTRGMEFGVSPFPESRRAMIERGQLFGVPGFRWIPARTRVEVEYWIVCRVADRIPERLDRPS